MMLSPLLGRAAIHSNILYSNQRHGNHGAQTNETRGTRTHSVHSVSDFFKLNCATVSSWHEEFGETTELSQFKNHEKIRFHVTLPRGKRVIYLQWYQRWGQVQSMSSKDWIQVLFDWCILGRHPITYPPKHNPWMQWVSRSSQIHFCQEILVGFFDLLNIRDHPQKYGSYEVEILENPINFYYFVQHGTWNCLLGPRNIIYKPPVSGGSMLNFQGSALHKTHSSPLSQ